MALEKDIVLANGLSVKKAYIQLTTAVISKSKKAELDGDGNKIPIEEVPDLEPAGEDESKEDFHARRDAHREMRRAAKRKGHKLFDSYMAVAHVSIYADRKTAKDPDGKPVERRSLTFDVDPNLSLMAQVYDKLKTVDDFSGAKDI